MATISVEKKSVSILVLLEWSSEGRVHIDGGPPPRSFNPCSIGMVF